MERNDGLCKSGMDVIQSVTQLTSVGRARNSTRELMSLTE